MSNIYGLLGVSDSDRVFLSTIGQQVVLDAINQYIAQINDDVNRAYGVFVERTIEDHKIRYKLPGGGRMQAAGFAPQGRPAAVKVTGEWDVAFPIASYQDAIGGDRVSMAYMTAQDLERHLSTVRTRYINTRRFEILKAILNNTERTFTDPLWGSLLVEPGANGDAVLYPPVLGSESEATETHYLETGYLAAAIDDTHNPYGTAVAELEEHFGAPTGGSNIVCFINNAQTAKTQALTEFVSIEDLGVLPGQDTATVINVPTGLPGKLLGRLSQSGAWVIEWRWVPANYIVAIHLDAPAPLLERVDPGYTGLPRGLALIVRDQNLPFETSYYDARFGFGAGNRLNMVVIELGNGGTYTIPTGYS